MNTPSKRKIAIYTGNRAEYGLQYPIIRAVADHPGLEYYLLVSGAHLQEAFGYTKREIETDGFTVHREINLAMDEDTVYATAQAIGSGILDLGRCLNDIRPDFLIVYADRFEGFSAVITGSQMNIPTVHIEGGDLTEGGALDDSVRHAMTKLSHLHFTTNKQASDRIRQMGEEPWRIHTVGLPALDLVAVGNFAEASEIVERFGIDLNRPVVIFTQHSVTTEFENAGDQIRPALAAMQRLATEGCQVMVTYPNNDAGARRILHEIEILAAAKIPNIQVHKSLGRYTYHGVLNVCARACHGVCVGNSSSGIKETPIFGCPVVNIGSRQSGRLRADNVLDAPYDEVAIYDACKKAISDNAFRDRCAHTENPYGVGDAGKRIAQILSEIPYDPMRLLQKKMTY